METGKQTDRVSLLSLPENSSIFLKTAQKNGVFLAPEGSRAPRDYAIYTLGQILEAHLHWSQELCCSRFVQECANFLVEVKHCHL